MPVKSVVAIIALSTVMILAKNNDLINKFQNFIQELTVWKGWFGKIFANVLTGSVHVITNVTKNGVWVGFPNNANVIIPVTCLIYLILAVWMAVETVLVFDRERTPTAKALA